MKIDTVSHSNYSVEYKPSEVQKVSNVLGVTDNEQQQDQHQRVQDNKNKDKELTKNEAKQVIDGMNEFLKPKLTSLKFKLHDDLDRYYVEVVDKKTDKVVREIPSKELLDMYAKMTEFLGLFIDEKL